MAEAGKSRSETFATVLKDVVSALRDSVLFLLFILLLFAPATIKERLVAAGFTKGSIGGLEWEAQAKSVADQTKSVGQSVEQANVNYTKLIERLDEVEKKITDPLIKSEVKSIGNVAETSRVALDVAGQTIKRSLAVQQQAIAQIAPSAVADSGWVFLGKVTENKTSWVAGSPQTVNAAPLPVSSGTTLTVRDDIYLHADSSPSTRSSAAILGVVKVGDNVEVIDIDYSHAKGGGWFVWAKVRRH